MLHSVYSSARLSLPVTLVTFDFLLFFTPLLLLNYFLFNLFLFLQKSGGAKAPPQPLPLRGPCVLKHRNVIERLLINMTCWQMF